LVRVNKEIKRRARVVGMFPNDAAAGCRTNRMHGSSGVNTP
jgi:transposase-like protein